MIDTHSHCKTSFTITLKTFLSTWAVISYRTAQIEQRWHELRNDKLQRFPFDVPGITSFMTYWF